MIKERWESVRDDVQKIAMANGRAVDEVKIVAVSKTHPAETIIEGIKAGVDCFGENYVQELKDKQQTISEILTEPVNWHFIGHLQTNKVKFIVPFINMIHSVDSSRLANEIASEAKKSNRTIEVLLQVNTSGELSKSGCEPEEIFKLYEETIDLENIKIKGLMTIGSFTEDTIQIRKEFVMLRNLRDELNRHYLVHLEHLSMGMSGDYPIAIEEGATLIRIGTAIFGDRDYHK